MAPDAGASWVYRADMNEYVIKPLGLDTWYDFARLTERQGNASFGPPGCWCRWFHPSDVVAGLTATIAPRRP